MEHITTNVSGGQCSQPMSEEETRQYRATLNNFILLNLKKSLTSEEDIQDLFRCITSCVNHMPMLLVYSPNCDSIGISSETQQNNADAKAFTRWLLVQLYQLLGKYDSDYLYNHTLESITSINKIVRENNLAMFKVLTQDLVNLILTLCESNADFSSGKCSVNLLPQGLEEPSDQSSLNLSIELLEILERKDLDRMLHLLLNVLEQVLDGLILLNSKLISSVWILLCRIISDGTMNNIKMAVKCIHILIKSGEISHNNFIYQHSVSILLSLVEYVYCSTNEFEDLEENLSSILRSLLMINGNLMIKEIDYQECATTLCKIRFKVISDSSRHAYDEIIINLVANDEYLVIPWSTVLQGRSYALKDVEFLSIVKFHLITKEMKVSNYQKWTQTSTWMNLMEQFENKQLKNDENFLDGLLLTCDMIATIVVLANHRLHNSECTLFLDSIFQFWESVISNRCNWSKETICNFYEIVICFCSSLFKLRDWEPLFEDRSLILSFLISLPWIQQAPNTYDLSFGKFISNKVLLIAARDHLDGHKSQSLPILALLPSEIVIDWRIFIFKKEMCSKDSQLATSALRSLPSLLQVLGLSFCGRFDHFFKNMKENADGIDFSELVSIFLQYTCVLYSTTTIKWCAAGFRENTTVSRLNCSKKAHSSHDKRLEKLCEDIWRVLFIHPNASVRKDVANNLPHILLHFGANDVIFDLCLHFLEDDCHDNRLLFGRCTSFFNTYFSDYERNKHHNLFSLRVRSVYDQAKESRRISHVETLAIAIATLAKVTENELLHFGIIFLLENVHSSNIFARATSTLQLREIAEFKNLSPRQLFVNCCQSISKLIFKLLCEAQEKGDNSPLDIIESTVQAFELIDVDYALKQMLPYLLPNLMENMSDRAHQLMIMIAAKLKLSLRGMIFNEFKNIFCYLICYSSQEKHNKILSYIMKETEATIDDLLLNHNQSVYNELMLHLISNREEAIAVLQRLPSRGENLSALTSTEMFLGFLAFFDTHIFNPNVSFENKKLAVQSLAEAFKLMGSKNLSIVYMKAMATLRILLRLTDKSIVPLCCEVWLTFIKTMDPNVIGSTLSQIVVALLPLVKIHLEGLKRILEYLIIEKRNVFQNYFCDLYCIPDIPEFAHLLRVIRESLGNPKSKTDLKNMLTPIINGIIHENIDVRTHTMIYLNNLLCQHQELFKSLILYGDSVDLSISRLIEKLMISCKDNDTFTQNLIGKCLGKLGAIDPSRLQIEDFQNLTSRKSSNIYFTIEEDDFIVELLTTLTKAFLGAPDNLVQNCASYAIQEVLQLYEVSSLLSKSQTKGGRIWNMLSGNIRDNLQLLFHSRFVCEENLNYSKLQGRPIYNSSFGLTFPKWLTTWTEYMISNVLHSKARKLFWVCRKIVRHDIKVALFLLPYVIIYTIQENSPNFVEEVIQEISLVLKTSIEISATENELNRMSVQVIFSMIDYLNSWVLVKRLVNTPHRRKNLINSGDKDFDVDYVSPFLERIPKLLLADASFNAQAYARALINIESHIKSDSNSLNNHLGFLLKLYKALDEPDGVAGIAHISQGSSIHDQILSHENSGRQQDALLCYQRALLDNSKDLQLCEGYLQCLMDLDFPQTALVYSVGVLTQNPTWERPMKSYQVEAAWKLANWNTLDNYLDSNGPINPTWGYRIGKILATVSHRDKSCYLKELEICRGDQMLPLIAASLENGSYERTYEYVLRFHMLEEIDQAVETFLEAGKDDNRIEQVNGLIHQWQFRQQLIRTSKRCLEPVLNLRRVLLGMAINNFGLNLSTSVKLEISRLWLHSAKISRRSGQLQPDYSSILSPFIEVLPEVGLEQAKWHWLKGEKEQATCCLNKIIYELNSNLPDNSKKIKAKAMLLLARYSEESGNLESNSIIEMFKEAVTLDSEREDSYYFFAKYYDKLLSVYGKLDKRPDLVLNVIKYFGQSLKYGCRYVHMSMPRLLSLWLDFGSNVVEADANKNTNSNVAITLRKTLSVINTKIIRILTKDLPSFLFYTAFSQLISRICHSHHDVFNNLKEIIAKLLVDYPQQALWLMTGVSKSSYAIRAKRCQEIFQRACQLSPQLTTFHSDANKLTDLLVKLCNMSVENGVSVRVSTHFGGLKKLLENPRFSKIILPCQLSLNVILPSVIPADSATYNPFPHSLVYIQSIEDQIEVMLSLQRPKKITIRGSDGKLYSLMCKPKDDLRKDCRLMEFNSMVNKFLMKDPESRRRHLHIRTYAVVPLNEECGIIEWVPNLNGLRGILIDIYKEKGIMVPTAVLKGLGPNKQDSPIRKLDIFKNSLLPRFPPVLSEWFLRTFTDPNLWYVARSSYARTSAVMSMVGYILGLGDRHGENILLDSSCGDTVHVDFNCLFNKGETFDVPELVPFRLTHNMVDAMGPLGHQGIFRKSCETTLRVMRKEMDTLMSFLKPFIYDPLVEWSLPTRNQTKVSSRSESSGQQGEITNEMARTHVQDIELRLTGVLKIRNLKGAQSNPFPLSVEGQVTALIKQATDEKNLSQMYLGWAAYM